MTDLPQRRPSTGSRPLVIAVGLGPAGSDLILPAALECLTAPGDAPVMFRTARHPAAAELIELLRGAGKEVRTFDDSYEDGSSFEAVYASIAETVIAQAAASGHVVYAVPGSPVVAERTVDLLLANDPTRSPLGWMGRLYSLPGRDENRPRRPGEQASRHPPPGRDENRRRRPGEQASGHPPPGVPPATPPPRISIELALVPGLSFCDLAWARLGIDPVAEGVRLVDGSSFGWQAAGDPGPVLAGQCWSNAVLSNVKLALEEPADGQRAVILHHLGLADEVVAEVAWEEIDRTVDADHLTSLYVSELAPPVAVELMKLVDTVATLRRLCPWDREQTHLSLLPHLLEETYEAMEAFGALGDTPDEVTAEASAHAEDELGDLLCQVVFHAGLAREEGLFDISDVARSSHEKLVSRHPHVFGDVRADTAAAVVRNWELIKESERPAAGLLDGIPAALPALARVAKVERKLASAGLGWDRTGAGVQPSAGLDSEQTGVDPARRRLDPPVPDERGAGAPGRRRDDEQAAGDRLLALARNLAHDGIDAEKALRQALDRLVARVEEIEAAAAREGAGLRGSSPDDLASWFRDGAPRHPDGQPPEP